MTTPIQPSSATLLNSSGVTPVGIDTSLFFFFQAEDGIRDLTVTGVQTCALPILMPGRPNPDARRARRLPAPFPQAGPQPLTRRPRQCWSQNNPRADAASHFGRRSDRKSVV